jgi:SAM-dependent methyltransferase
MRDDFYADYFRSEDRHWWFIGRRNILLALLDRQVGPGPPGTRRILDVGCGAGTMLGYLSRYGAVEGVESEEAAVSLCRQRGIDNVVRATVPPLPFPDGRFQLVTALDVIEHVDDDAGALAEIRRVLAPGGRAFITVPAYRFLWGNQDRIAHHKRRYVAPELGARLVAAGLLPRRLTYFNSFLFPAIAAVRLGRRLLPSDDRPRSDLEMTSETGVANRLLARLFSAEAALLLRRDLPVGVSLLAIAEAPGGGPAPSDAENVAQMAT